MCGHEPHCCLVLGGAVAGTEEADSVLAIVMLPALIELIKDAQERLPETT